MRSKPAVQVIDRKRSELAGDHGADVYGDVMVSGRFKKFRRGSQVPADNDAGDRITEIGFKDLPAALGRLLFKISHLCLPDQLRPFEGEKLIETAELHSGTVQVRRPDIPFGL